MAPCLSLGSDGSKPFGCMDKATDVSNNSSIGFCMGLSIASNPKYEKHLQPQDNGDHEEDDGEVKDSNNNTASARTTKVKRASSDDTEKDPPIIQLDLLPNTPVVAPRRQPSSDGIYEPKRPDVNRLPEAKDKGALSSSPPDSATSSFQMGFCRPGNHHDAERASSRASDENENGHSRNKLRLTKEQSAFLEETFKEHSTLTPKQKLALAEELNLRPRQVEVWFQNRRARTKLKQTEVDCEYLKSCCEKLTEENRRLLKELQELRALKSSNSFYMELPATTLTMCPSCQKLAASNKSSTTPPTFYQIFSNTTQDFPHRPAAPSH